MDPFPSFPDVSANGLDSSLLEATKGASNFGGSTDIGMTGTGSISGVGSDSQCASVSSISGTAGSSSEISDPARQSEANTMDFNVGAAAAASLDNTPAVSATPPPAAPAQSSGLLLTLSQLCAMKHSSL